jgi:hypothetical protein
MRIAEGIRIGLELVILTSILDCVKKIRFCPRSKSKKFKFSLGFGEVSPSPFWEGGRFYKFGEHCETEGY